MSGEIVMAFGLGGMAASLFILALCKSAGDADRWLERHEPSDPCAEAGHMAPLTRAEVLGKILRRVK